MGTLEMPAFGGVVRTVLSDSEITGEKISKELEKKAANKRESKGAVTQAVGKVKPGVSLEP